MSTTSKTLTFLPIVARIILLLYGIYQDSLPIPVKYTDVDYYVFTDAANLTSHGASPYIRSTYRYTPILSFLLLPGIWTGCHSWWGKAIFILGDIASTVLLSRICKSRGINQEQSQYWIAGIWSLNPFVATISTRGSSESLAVCLVLWAVYLSLVKRWKMSAVVLGVAIHFKIYPVIYGAPCLVSLKPDGAGVEGTWRDVMTLKRVQFVAICSGTFVLLSLAMYTVYGYPFIQESYLYHFTRQDHRHNFSVYFYSLYLTSSSHSPALWSRLVSFAPQLGLVAFLGFRYGHDLPFACFLQTFAFVMLNKVCTSQYFMWYLCFLPIILPTSSLAHSGMGLCMLVAWVLGQALWLNYAYQLEHLGRNTFRELWIAGCVFYIVNCWILYEFVQDGSTWTVPKAAVEKKKKKA
ncbi:hypothetical protein SmJEL517_g05286 [Synchytrium microbalum]|uniref:GPI mannosyltransferase 1 n=1 Tax=Synchytrium microbalum TaxID=1806994 RepID=A0A507BV00_9FUNG|nr:uncharacterized protein SmJEL517_g05286 [Synchytrium microbalum]TPX31352.1 hypothetical protein SmJEL517_g05286 [Synchytrium microbalum]